MTVDQPTRTVFEIVAECSRDLVINQTNSDIGAPSEPVYNIVRRHITEATAAKDAEIERLREENRAAVRWVRHLMMCEPDDAERSELERWLEVVDQKGGRR